MKSQKEIKTQTPKVWVISVDMGYGHQRAAYPLKDIVFDRIITANKDSATSSKDKKIWERSRIFYETVSKLKKIPIIGPLTFGTYDKLQEISPFFPFRDLSKPNFSVLRLKSLIKKGFGKSIVDYTSKENIPVITTFHIVGMFYEYNGKECYCIVTDTDAHRIWASDEPKNSKLKYFSPCKHVSMRLIQYGVRKENIIETGFPLPKENIGEKDEIVKKDLLSRLINLDPAGVFFEKYKGLVAEKLNLQKNFKFEKNNLEKYKTHKLTITYTIGGAGAQREIAIDILRSLREKILSQDIIVNIVVGTKLDLKMYFEEQISQIGLKDRLEKNINIIFDFQKKELFEKTNQILRTTDILWTKPSEMSFYAALGIPIIIAPPIGAHENYNKEWLEQIGSGFIQQDPKFTNDWLYYWINSGQLADAAIQGFIDAPRRGTYNIEEYFKNKQNKYKGE